MKLDLLEQYLELAEYDAIERLYNVFTELNKKISFTENESNTYDFYNMYKKEITILVEFDIMEIQTDFLTNDHIYKTKGTQLEMLKAEALFKEYDADLEW